MSPLFEYATKTRDGENAGCCISVLLRTIYYEPRTVGPGRDWTWAASHVSLAIVVVRNISAYLILWMYPGHKVDTLSLPLDHPGIVGVRGSMVI